MRLKLKSYLWLLAALLTCTSLVLVESRAIVVDYVEVGINGLPQELDGLRLVHISDFHGRKLPDGGRLIEKIQAANPHFIALTGDYVNRSADEVNNILPFVRALTSIAPVYAVSGNHDHYAGWQPIAELLLASGVNVLQNAHRYSSYNGAQYVVAGVNDPFTGRADLSIALPQENLTTILLAHSPTWFEARHHSVVGGVRYTAALRNDLSKVDLTLVGHTHGGQIKLPLLGALSNASGRMFPRDYIEGLSYEGTGWLYISRGIGYTMLPIRFLSRAQVTVLTLRLAH